MQLPSPQMFAPMPSEGEKDKPAELHPALRAMWDYSPTTLLGLTKPLPEDFTTGMTKGEVAEKAREFWGLTPNG